MRRRVALAVAVGTTAAAAVGAVATNAGAAPADKADKSALGHFKHLVVIYEENHSFDNLYGGWGSVNGQSVEGLHANAPGTTQVDQQGAPIGCELQNDANLGTTSQRFYWIGEPTSAAPTHPGHRTPACSGTLPNGGSAFDSAFTSSAPFPISSYVSPDDTSCAPPNKSAASTGVLAATQDDANGDPTGVKGGCTRDLVHRFYQEQYQLDGGQQDRYSTGSDAAGLTQGYYDTKSLPVYSYLHSSGAPKYVVADHFFQAAFGGSFLNHQYLIAAQAPQWDTSQRDVPAGKNSVLDSAGFPNKNYPLYRPDPSVAYNDSVLTQKCGQSTTVTGLACGNYGVNTMQPSWTPSAGGSNVLPGINDVDPQKPYYETNIGDELSAKGVSWNWYSGGWDAAASGHADPLFQYHHQPFNYFQNYKPGAPGRTHLKDETDFVSAVQNGTLPAVSFVKPVGEENEHPGYASTDNGEKHLRDLIQRVENGPEAGNTLIVVTYDEFGGQWDHVAPPGQGANATSGPHDQFGPGTRIPALIIGRSLQHSAVDHTSYDTTSILATIERAFGVSALGSRDAGVNDLSHALIAAGTKSG